MNFLKKLHSIFNKRSTGELLHVTESFGKVIDTCNDDLKLLKLEYVILTSTGDWLDQWGEWFGVVRKDRETDTVYSKRIIAETIAPKSTLPALKASVDSFSGYTGDGTELFEPYTQVRIRGESPRGSGYRYEDATYWRWHVVDIKTRYVVTKAVKELLDSIKSAGIKLYYTMDSSSGGEVVLMNFGSVALESFTKMKFSPDIVSSVMPNSQVAISRKLATQQEIVTLGRFIRGYPLYSAETFGNVPLTNYIYAQGSTSISISNI